ncbi:MAG: magnesium transporter [Pelagibacterales bacterium]|nr:magnesium transporter [Pelagibacterales bacterium]|tara:strand:- start:2370 stop:3773 length:1404 start_codon:yes stop_codon:yes gene_type:complete
MTNNSKTIESKKKKNNNAKGFGISKDQLEKIRDNIRSENIEFLKNNVLNLHHADIADIFEILSEEDRKLLAVCLENSLPAEVLASIDEQVLSEILDNYKPGILGDLIGKLDTDEAVYVIENIDIDRREALIKQIPSAERKLIRQALEFPEMSAGRLMQRDYVAVPKYWNVGQVIDYLRGSVKVPDQFYSIFIVDPKHVPVGTVPLHRIMRNKRNIVLTDIMIDDPVVVKVNTDQEDIAYLFEKYDLTSAPVVNARNRLIGMITVDDVVEVIQEEAEEDMLKLAGVSGDTDLYMAAWKTARSRFSWLFINLLTAILASISIGFFEGTIKQIVALAVLMPIVASMGGNAGTQTLTVAVRAIATRELNPSNSLRVFGKEILVGLINGIVFAVIVGLVAALWFGEHGLGIVIALAMMFNLLVAGFFGASIPIMLQKLKVDPALGASILLTTVTDVVGFFVFLGLAQLMLVN